MTLMCNGFQLQSEHVLSIIDNIFDNYTNLMDIRNRQLTGPHKYPVWLEYLSNIQNDLLLLVETNLSPELIIEYMDIINNNTWNNELAIRRSCKNVDKAIEFIKKHFILLYGQQKIVKEQQLKNNKKSHLKVIK